MENIKQYFKVGQTGYDVTYGEGKVISTNNSVNYPIRVRFENSDQTYCADGRSNISDYGPSLFQNEPIITPNIPIIEFEKGDLVWVSNKDHDGVWHVRFFSHMEDNLIHVFKIQKNDGDTYSGYTEIEKFEDNPLLNF